MGLSIAIARLDDLVEEVAEKVKEGDLDGAAVILGSQGGKIGEFQTEWDGVYEQVCKLGGDPARGIRRS